MIIENGKMINHYQVEHAKVLNPGMHTKDKYTLKVYFISGSSLEFEYSDRDSAVKKLESINTLLYR